ncbi:MAG TPA: sugar phosphate isomerase/epimerase [Planctomycetota bacterium]|nr:sugar phosphate isomerase/epimerase [Planctomycetota bacterium]
MNLRYGVSSCLAAGPSRAGFLEKLAAAGFADLELGADAGSFGGWLTHPARARREIEAAGLRVRSVHTPEAGWDNSAPDPDKRRAAAGAAAACLGPAAEVGAGVVVWHPTYSGHDWSPAAVAGHVARSGEALAAFAAAARAAGLRVAVENLPRRGTPRPLASVVELLPFVAAHGADVGICLDAGHSNANGLSAAEEVRAAGSRLFATHIQDNDGQGGDQHLLPGRGTTDWPAFVRALDATGYSGGRIFEVVGAGGGVADVLDALARTARDWTSQREVGRKEAQDAQGA